MFNIEFFALLIGPFFADLLGGHFIMLSIAGMSLWSLSLALHIIQHNTKDQRLKSILRVSSRTALLGWILYWAYAQFFSSTPIQHPLDFFKVLNLSHAAFLVLSFVLIIVNVLSSAGGLLKEKTLRTRRKGSFFEKLPSIESLLKTCRLTWSYAVKFWGLGLFLATFSLWLKHLSPTEVPYSATLTLILQQPKLIVTVVLWSFLIIALPVFNKLRTQSVQNYLSAYFLGSVLFVSLFSFLIKYSEDLQHEALRWVLR